MNQGAAYLNGQWIDAAQLSVPVDDLGFVLGATVVERLRTFNGVPFRVEEHLRRFRHSLQILGWGAECLTAEVREALAEFSARNRSLIAPGDDWSIAAFITPGSSADAARPTVCVHGGPLAFHTWAAKFDAGIDLCVTEVRQVPANCWPPELKCRSRIHYYLADQEAARRCPGARAVLLDQRGFIGEASTANVVAFFADRGLVTPRLQEVLPGISQQVLFELAAEQGVPQVETDLRPEEFAAADEAFLCSTSICLQPVVTLDGQPIGSGQPGRIYRQLLAAWSKKVGVDIPVQAKKFAQRI